MADLKTTPLHDLHRELGARMVEFAGWSMPLQYPAGIMKEHLWCREHAGLFDVSHMGQIRIHGDDAPGLLETLVPADLASLAVGRARYTVLTDDDGGILDDLIVTRTEDGIFLVVNAGCRDEDFAHIEGRLGTHAVTFDRDAALLALQGPRAEMVLARLEPGIAELRFMGSAEFTLAGLPVRISRLGYTGEDGFEIALAAGHALKLARTLLAAPEVMPIGLGARDSLRLEAGLCLYGHDIDRTTSPIEAQLAWTIGKRRRAGLDFPGGQRIGRELAHGPARKLVGLRPEGRAPVREGCIVHDAEAGTPIGTVTSGCFSPSLQAPIALAHVAADHAAPGTHVSVMLRGKPTPARVAPTPFVEHRYKR